VALLAALAITAVVGFLARKRLAWETWIDMPVGLTTSQAAGTQVLSQVLMGEPGLRYHEPPKTAPDRAGSSCSASQTPDAPVYAAGTSAPR
jgi:hypothetical protein